MLVVRSAQVDALQEQSRQAAEQRMANNLRAHVPSACAGKSPEELAALVKQGTGRAAEHGLTSERDVNKYLGLMAVFGDDFDQQPWAASLLAGPDVDPGIRTRLLLEEAERQQPSSGIESGTPATADDGLTALGRQADASGARSLDEAVEPCPLKQKTFVAVQLVGEDGSPVPGERYRITVPGARTIEGRLDAGGKAVLEGLEPGSCRILFPDLDKDAWEAI